MSGTMNYFSDLNISIEDVSLLVVSEALQCPTLGDIPRQGFLSAWSPLNATTLQSQQTHVRLMMQKITQPSERTQSGLYRRVYKHTFKLACQPGAKSIPLETAAEFWKNLFSDKAMAWVSADETEWFPMYLAFLQEKWKKAVNKDLWDQTLLFALKTLEDPSMSWWSEDSAWPGIIDEFVGFAKEKTGVAAQGDRMDES